MLVGTPVAPPVSAAGCFSAGGYEHLAGAQGITAGLPPPAPTMVPMAAPAGAMPEVDASASNNVSSTFHLCL